MTTGYFTYKIILDRRPLDVDRSIEDIKIAPLGVWTNVDLIPGQCDVEKVWVAEENCKTISVVFHRFNDNCAYYDNGDYFGISNGGIVVQHLAFASEKEAVKCAEDVKLLYTKEYKGTSKTLVGVYICMTTVVYAPVLDVKSV